LLETRTESEYDAGMRGLNNLPELSKETT
jgi:hypothetical protein